MTDTPAVFRASYAEWKVIKTRAAVQLIFEIPIEKADEAYQVLGGMPIAAHEVWCGIARLNGKEGEATVSGRNIQAQVDTPPRPAATPLPAGADKERRSLSDMAPSQQAGMFSNDRAFRLFLAEKFDMPLPDPDEAADVIRHHCKVKSRAEITADNVGWSELVLGFQVWKRAAEIVPA